MKTVLNLVLSANFPPYTKMVQTAIETWDSVEVEGVETVYYFGEPIKPNTDKFIYLPVKETYNDMTEKTFSAFEWALENKQFDYLSRSHSCIYVNKKNLLNHVQGLPDKDVFATIKVVAEPVWGWAGAGLIFSRDVVEKAVKLKNECQWGLMEDMNIAYVINKIGIPYTEMKACTIDKMENCWRMMCYGGGESFEFTDFEDVKKAEGHFNFRCKQDGKREVDKYLMEELFRVLG